MAFGVCMHAWVSVCVYERARDLEGFTRADLMRRKTTLTGQRLSLHLKWQPNRLMIFCGSMKWVLVGSE